MKCMECGGEMFRSSEPIQTEFKGEELLVPDIEHWQCAACGEVEFESADIGAFEDAQNRIYREVHELLSPQEIKALRKKYKLKQSQFERVLGVTSPTASRWETGAVVQSKIADNLMRLMIDSPAAAIAAIRRAGFDVPEDDSMAASPKGAGQVRILWNIPQDAWASFKSASTERGANSDKRAYASYKDGAARSSVGKMIEAA